MDTPEQNQPDEEAIVELGKQLPLINLDKLVKSELGGHYYRFQLNLGDHLVPFIVDFTAISNPRKKVDTFTPFDPESGYIITDEDFDPQKQKEKRDQIKDTIDKQLVPFILNILSRSPHYFSHDQQALFQKLRLQLSFPAPAKNLIRPVIYESRIGNLALSVGRASFGEFYPRETGPLSIPDFPGSNPGLSIGLPDDPQKLASIMARFYIDNRED